MNSLEDSAAIDAAAALDGLRARGAHSFDPVQFRFIEALARRAAALQGPARELVERRLGALLAAYARHVDAPPPKPAAGAPRRSALGTLLDQLDPRGTEGEALRELRTMQQHRGTWSKLSVDQRLTRALAKVTHNAGPLNSHGLVLRMLESMRDLSPAYLDRFMLHVDALLWLDRTGPARARAQEPPPADGENRRKTTRRGARKPAAR